MVSLPLPPQRLNCFLMPAPATMKRLVLNSDFHSDVETFVKHCVLQRCPTEIQAPFNEDILTVYESSNRPLSKAKTHFPAEFKTFRDLPADHCTGCQSEH